MGNTSNRNWLRLILVSALEASVLKVNPSSAHSSSTSDLVEKQKIQTPSWVYSLCQINENRNRIEFASGHLNGQIMIWSKQINGSNHYSSIRTLQPFNNHDVDDLIFINDNGRFDFLIVYQFHETT
jgi:hypothetical protein